MTHDAKVDGCFLAATHSLCCCLPRALRSQPQVTPIIVQGYRPGAGIDSERFPTNSVCKAVEDLHASLASHTPRETVYTQWARGEVPYEAYIEALRAQLDTQGGAWVTVAPRDTSQQGNDSESAGITALSRRNAEVFAQQAGCVGYEVGGAQYQAGMIRGFDPAEILRQGLPYNMAAHSLQRSQYVNGLAELPAGIRGKLFDATADIVRDHYGTELDTVPWIPYVCLPACLRCSYALHALRVL